METKFVLGESINYEINSLIQSITIIRLSESHIPAFDKQSHKVSIDLSLAGLSDCNAFDIKIAFSEPIAEFRNHDYTWKKRKEYYVANEFSPKIIKLQNGQIVQSNLTFGVWEIDPKEPTILLWRFNPEYASPIVNYLGDENRKTISSAKQKFKFNESPALLFPKVHVIEFSRSKIPFSAIACFTDHCDFDTAENLSVQRRFFKEHEIKVTKGFFLNHFSKREENASFQNQKEELLKWKDDGHELCYHSLSQSIKPNAESFDDFKKFVPPLSDLKVWIDHGYQPYNFSLFKKNNIPEEDFSNLLKDKEINVLWNYIDSGTAADGVINQLNKEHFTLSSFLKGTKDFKWIKQIQLMIKNIVFHYYNDENMILKYKETAKNFKKVFFQKRLASFLPLIKDFFRLSGSILAVFLLWKTNKIKPYKLAKYSPILFKHYIAQKEFYVFQTLELLDFRKALSKENVTTLINEKGVFIAHTYFSVPMKYHEGRLMLTEKQINREIEEGFKFLSDKIKNKEIWNPTLMQLIEYWQGFEKVVLDIDSDGDTFVKSESDLIFRKFT
ncbi:hypothetical protein [Flavobacterium sp. N502540]|uniref:hypothetical protein n=1 Tax=Flavobacterium sp. N502540 TaxID=2986838 RepID=UPI002223FD4D|nr:hypothetical protein [Flavobacterium sp. N502540]